ncbi:hypothetical protein LR48_Vigan11g061300 [Vigna angularis]|uniref:Uncharacterized protein n=1 Tax=Phaseolus angularis TaxID=3914 RepID=A0A0L9VR86_PHAAN|nr:hypothetical protein LR48_Vigan11g061300 [Vigna angularis]
MWVELEVIIENKEDPDEDHTESQLFRREWTDNGHPLTHEWNQEAYAPKVARRSLRFTLQALALNSHFHLNTLAFNLRLPLHSIPLNFGLHSILLNIPPYLFIIPL